jgi:hypothetical protein
MPQNKVRISVGWAVYADGLHRILPKSDNKCGKQAQVALTA